MRNYLLGWFYFGRLSVDCRKKIKARDQYRNESARIIDIFCFVLTLLFQGGSRSARPKKVIPNVNLPTSCHHRVRLWFPSIASFGTRCHYVESFKVPDLWSTTLKVLYIFLGLRGDYQLTPWRWQAVFLWITSEHRAFFAENHQLTGGFHTLHVLYCTWSHVVTIVCLYVVFYPYLAR